MSNGKAYKGSCFCGAVQLTVTGEPAAMGYCHGDNQETKLRIKDGLPHDEYG